ncbi:hypothetical protein METBIDRAFT_37785 [Metschnikowia bicuspidata var. bicuspidata NRRL YB-4993]|uniref:Zn(2)-C6 fungal-type domain-containing protein n=1 Tax=Metschnikowia bicuspidata var. bicuspidata NRRL YB-4993 TaxID=869754 RepID=A0A1A0HHT2_9ASCO|nr:hypothetical protein METBIDRAFT_37785 [Metschnikowia bicuspidata var. bicuspidata NRRL YB-4993]OBA23403.1 hypothetical protein METBIDRAFT_37785 [Metschnikowia bicuspidata var. bicuspidata NRRL YB-4993]
MGLDFRASSDQLPTNKSGRSRRSRACKHCHALKVRCIPVDEDDPASSCVRCLNSKKECEIDFLEPKKRRKKTANNPEKDSVAELKKEIVALQSEVKYLRLRLASEIPGTKGADNGRLNNQNSTPSALDTPSPPFMTKDDLEKELGLLYGSDLSLKDISDEIKEYTTLRENTLQHVGPIDVVSLGITDLNSAKIRLDIYRKVLYSSHPYVNVPEHLSVEDMMKTQPFLLNVIIAITSIVRKDDSSFLQSLALEKHATTSVTREILVNGSKSVELVKCLILMSVWYNTPEFFKARRYHILNQMAVTLLYDLGIVSRQSFTYSGETKTIKKSEALFDDIEYRVLILTLYCSTVGFCLILRRAIFVKWTTYVEECCSVLESNPGQHYKNIALFLRLTRELEKVHHIVHSPDCFVTNPKISEYTITDLNTRLRAIGNTLTKDNHILLAYYYSIEAYLSQPLSEDLQVRSTGLNCTENLTTRTLNTISQCTSSCLKAMDEFNQLTDEQIAGLPLFHFTRYIYTAGILMRLRYFILSLPSNIEKDLVPRYAIVSVLNLHKRINAISIAYPTNFLMKKMKLVLRLFVQTYVTQVNELLTRNEDGTSSEIPAQVSNPEYKDMNKLAHSILSSSQGNQMGQNYSRGVHLDLLSYAATEHSKTNGVTLKGGDMADNSNKPDLPPSNGFTVETAKHPETLPTSLVTNISQLLPPMPQLRNNLGNRMREGIGAPSSGRLANGDVFPLPPLPVNTQQFLPINHNDAAPATDLTSEFRDLNKDIYELDDEFWSSLLTTDADRYSFAQDVPHGTENVLYNIFS